MFSAITVFSDNIHDYLKIISKFPILTRVEEKMYFKEYIISNNINSVHKLVTSHLRIVVSIALKYRNYGLPLFDLISEGNIGLMKAVKKFNPSKGVRLSTYAMWWIKSFIQDYIIKSWSILKISSSILQKKLFTSAVALKKKIKFFDHMQNFQAIAINKHINDSDTEVGDLIADKNSSIEENFIEKSEQKFKFENLNKAIVQLSKRERSIIISRRVNEQSITLKKLSIKYSISSERVRQIEKSALKKIRKIISVCD